MNHKSTFRTIGGVTEKLCGGCNIFQPHTPAYFHRNKTKGSGLNSHCKACQRVACNTLTNARNQAKATADASQLLAKLWPCHRRGKIA